MNLFIACAALLTLLVVAWLARALLKPKLNDAVTEARLNIAIHKDQLAALEADLAQGAISAQDFETTRDELQLRLLEDANPSPSFQPSRATLWTPQRTALALALTLPLLAFGLYWQLGSPQALLSPEAKQAAAARQVDAMVIQLEKRLKDNPNNPTGWAMLARSYKVLGRHDDARKAFENIGDPAQMSADTLVDYADLLAIQAQGQLQGKPLELVQIALAKDPQHPSALMMMGAAAYQKGDYAAAIAPLEKLLGLLEPGSPDAEQVNATLNEARQRAGLPMASASTPSQPADKLPPVKADAANAMTPEMIQQMVDRLAKRLQDHPDDTQGWARLARAYKVLGKLDEALAAYPKTGALLETNPDIMVQYADAMAMKAGRFEDPSRQLIARALQRDPNHPMALMMAGQDAFQQGHWEQAIVHWEKVLPLLPAGSNDATLVAQEIQQARAKLKTPQPSR
ncbi:MAG: hypothetical protein OHK0048_11410 [Rhodoferax sp.]